MDYKNQQLICAEIRRLLKVVKIDGLSEIHFFRTVEDVKQINWHLRIISRYFESVQNLLIFTQKLENEGLNQISNLILKEIDQLTELMSLNEESLNFSNKEEIFILSKNILVNIDNFKSELEKELIQKEKKYKKMARLMIRNLPRLNYLYHGVKLENVEGILNRGSILGYTTQRYWDNGKRYKDDHEKYQDSYWMKGISLTRDLEYALGWGSVVLIFDREKITYNHKLEHYNWHNHIANRTHSKKEHEEFLVLSKSGKKYKNKDNPQWNKDYQELLEYRNSPNFIEDPQEFDKFLEKETQKAEKINLTDIKHPEGEFKFNETLCGIILKKTTVEIFGLENSIINYLHMHLTGLKVF